MKKAIFLVSLMAATYTLSAQSVKFGIRGGLNLATVDRGSIPEGNETNNLAAFNGGLFANIRLGNWAVEPGLFYSLKGFKANYETTRNVNGGSTENVSFGGTIKYNYLELPVNILYNVKLTPGKVFFGGGPYAGYLMSANAKSTSTVGGVKQPDQTFNYTIGNNVDDLKRMDYGVNILAGFAFNNGFQLSAGYGYGLTNIAPGQNDNKIKNRVFNVSVGYSL
ncbi:hypothetical protein ABIB62_003029 [Mucilaginibacter sp. UYP25]|uniref:porin family protein n=1 Tax=unclassified Mucilaginibacter TaxID=2617802 RepID=UPI0033966143